MVDMGGQCCRVWKCSVKVLDDLLSDFVEPIMPVRLEIPSFTSPAIYQCANSTSLKIAIEVLQNLLRWPACPRVVRIESVPTRRLRNTHEHGRGKVNLSYQRIDS